MTRYVGTLNSNARAWLLDQIDALPDDTRWSVDRDPFTGDLVRILVGERSLAAAQ